MKLAVNLVLGLNRAVLAEGLVFAESPGLDLATTLDVLQAGPAASTVMKTKGEKMLEREFKPQARLAQHLKDVKVILDTGQTVGANLPSMRSFSKNWFRLATATSTTAPSSRHSVPQNDLPGWRVCAMVV